MPALLRLRAGHASRRQLRNRPMSLDNEPPSSLAATVDRVMAVAHLAPAAHVEVIGHRTLPFVLALLGRGGGAVRSLRLGALVFFSSRRRHTRWPRDWSSDVLFRSQRAAR